MSDADTPVLRTLAFGELASGAWGLLWGQGDAVGLFCAGSGTEPLSVALPAGELGAAHIAADGVSLEVEILESVSLTFGDEADEDDETEVLQARICRVTGRLTVAGEEHPVDHLGIEVEQPLPSITDSDSIRQVLAWFAPDDALTVAAARPRKTQNHDKDLELAVLFEPARPLPIDEARLSTTYTTDGVPRRMSLELWPAGEEDTYPRRVAGEVLGTAAQATTATATVHVHPMVCHRAGRDGLGLYVLTRPR